MRRNFIISVVLILSGCALVASDLQSLVEAARKEAERRRQIEELKLKTKRIEGGEGALFAKDAPVSVSSPRPESAPEREVKAKPPPRPTLISFRNRLEKLDRDIVQARDRLDQLKARADAERSAPVRLTLRSKVSTAGSTLRQLDGQIQAQETKLKRLLTERDDVFLAGRRAGYLPGELENRGVIR